MISRSAIAGIALIGAICVAGFAAASGTYAPPLPPRTNRVLLAGKKLWRSSRIVGAGGETCAGCHDSGQAPQLSRTDLLRKREDLPKLIYFELVTHSRNNVIRPGADKITALTQYLVNRYRLDQDVPLDHPEAAAKLKQAHSLYLSGDYSGSSELLQETLRLPASPEMHAETYILLGSIYQVLGEQARAVEAYFEVFRLFPDAQIDAEIFSPKIVELFEVIRRTSGASRSE